MKNLPAGLEAELTTGATTLCWCWRLARRDGAVLGFTDHDHDLMFDGTIYEAAAGFTASEIRDSVGLSVDNLEVEGALSSERLAEADLAAGVYDDARIEIFRVSWRDPTRRVLMRTGSLGEVRRAGKTFTAEVRGLAHYLQQTKGRLFQYTCDADLGDSRCGIDRNASTYASVGSVELAMSDRVFSASGLLGFADGWFTRGRLEFTSGAASGQAYEVKRHSQQTGAHRIELWQPPRGPLEPGQTFGVTAGCDKHPATCRTKFANIVNFRGFPHMPGNDILTRYARSGAKSA